ncbi:thialysine N-epsilon-acetyltransferase-like [Dunckerocampus dactyliophorus]|uniref:thialysine N-epsilon-acetyltransferase-like n=1 Tax=Dunckerocampus dactyliophorus TaxID=161453 RepID=UPI0024069A7F|nr:thialysine N-epsilon-acetyltransferase-like [Dunckerocampus dactyliophorus]
MNFTIRTSAKADCKDIWRLIKDLAIYENVVDEVVLSYEEFERDGFGKKPLFESLVAEVPEENKSKEGFTVVGVALYYYTYCTWNGRAVFLEDLYVMPEFRGFGIGTGLLSTLAKVVTEKSCNLMEVNVMGQNSRSRGFYAAAGARDVTVMDNWHTLRFDAKSLNKLANKSP